MRILPPMFVADEGKRLYSVNNPQEICVDVDAVISARVWPSGLSRTRSPLLISLREQNLILPAGQYPYDGIETDKSGRVINGDNAKQPTIWAFGPIVEGATFYNHYVPTPDKACQAILESRLAVKSCLETIMKAKEEVTPSTMK